MPLKNKKIVIPEGFVFSSAKAGIKVSETDDMGLIFCPSGAIASGVFTKNKVKAAPVVDAQRKLRRTGRIYAIVANSGCANACTGIQGMDDLKRITDSVASKLGVSEKQVIMASTGIIGKRLPVRKMLKQIDRLVIELGRASPVDFARAIMTTDRFPKVVSKRVKVAGSYGSILGIAKGAGMIFPNMATMLCFILTDIPIEKDAMKRILLQSVEETFNCITVDNDMSTNDTVLLLSSCRSWGRPVSLKDRTLSAVQDVITEVMDSLARMIVSDAEGASKTIEVILRGAGSVSEAKKAARAVAGSLLVKTAIYGADPNWGRIMAALGGSGIRLEQEKVHIKINGIRIVKNGIATPMLPKAKEKMKNSKHVIIEIELMQDGYTAKALGCDLTEEYVRFNAHYTT